MLAYQIIFMQTIRGIFLKMESGSIQRKMVLKREGVLLIDKESDAEYIFIENDEVKNHYNRLLEKGQEEKKKSTSCDIECDCACEPVQCGC